MAGFSKTMVDTTVSKQSLTIQQVETYDKGEIHVNLTDTTPSSQNFSGISTDPVNDSITLLDHGLVTGTIVKFTTTGSLPSPLTASSSYYVIKESANTLQLASSYDDAVSGLKIDITGEGSGTHTLKPTALSGLVVYVEKSGDRVNFQKVIEDQAVTDLSTPLILSLEDLVLPDIRLGVEVDSGQVAVTAIIYLKSYIN